MSFIPPNSDAPGIARTDVASVPSSKMCEIACGIAVTHPRLTVSSPSSPSSVLSAEPPGGRIVRRARTAVPQVRGCAPTPAARDSPGATASPRPPRRASCHRRSSPSGHEPAAIVVKHLARHRVPCAELIVGVGPEQQARGAERSGMTLGHRLGHLESLAGAHVVAQHRCSESSPITAHRSWGSAARSSTQSQPAAKLRRCRPVSRSSSSAWFL